MSSILSDARFHDEQAAFDYVEGMLWARGRVCPHCGVVGESGKLSGKSTRLGVYKCYACRKPFTVKVGTIFESSHVPLNLWLQAIHLIACSKKGISSNQLHRVLGVTLKSAWFMSHRVREAMKRKLIHKFGKGGGTVESDETFIGREPGKPKRRAYGHKMKVLTLIDRVSGEAHSEVVDDLSIPTIRAIVHENVAREARLVTDEARQYISIGRDQTGGHASVNHHAEEYVSPVDPTVHTNTVEGYFSVFKRGMKGVYQHCAKHHLHRYTAEFDFRYSNRIALGVDDSERAEILLKRVSGKRLTYRTPRRPTNQAQVSLNA